MFVSLFSKEAIDYHTQTGLGPAPQVLLNGVPMSKDDLSVDTFEEAVVTSILRLTSDIQRAVYHVSNLYGLFCFLHKNVYAVNFLNSKDNYLS